MKFFKSKISMIPIVHLFHPLGSSKHWRKTSDYTHFLLLSNIFDHSNDQATGCRQGFSLAETPGDSLCRLGDKLSLLGLLSLNAIRRHFVVP